MALYNSTGGLYGRGQYGVFGINPQQQAINTFSDDWGQGLSNFSPISGSANSFQDAMAQGLNANTMGFNPTVTGLGQQGMQGMQNAGGGMGGLAGYLGAGAGLLQGIGGLANAFMAAKGLELAEEQFGFQKGLANRNLANQSKIINNAYDNAAQVAAGMIGGGSYDPKTDTQGSYGQVDQATVDRYAAKAREKHVDGSPV